MMTPAIAPPIPPMTAPELTPLETVGIPVALGCMLVVLKMVSTTTFVLVAGAEVSCWSYLNQRNISVKDFTKRTVVRDSIVVWEVLVVDVDTVVVLWVVVLVNL